MKWLCFCTELVLNSKSEYFSISCVCMIVFLREDERMRYVRKPAWIPCTFGPERSFLEMCIEGGSLERAYVEKYGNKQRGNYFYLPEQLQSGLEMPSEETREQFAKRQQSQFTKDDERWLVNRLDTVTAWYVYVAKNRELYKERSELQQNDKITKSYMALVHWDVRYMFKDVWGKTTDVADPAVAETVKVDADKKQMEISFPLWHHLHLDDRMVAIRWTADLDMIRWAVQPAMTQCTRNAYHEKENMTMLSLTITKGVRHQIRAHLWALWYPIVGDPLYGKRHFDKLRSGLTVAAANDRNNDLLLHLRSLGCEIN